MLKLCDGADAVVENYRGGVMDRLGLSYETLHARNPKLVYATIRGFGDPRTGKSPYSDFPAYDVISQAMGGIMAITGPDKDTPMKVGPGVGDIDPGDHLRLRHRLGDLARPQDRQAASSSMSAWSMRSSRCASASCTSTPSPRACRCRKAIIIPCSARSACSRQKMAS